MNTIGGFSITPETIQDTYNVSPTPTVLLSATAGPFTVQDAAAPLGTELFRVRNSAGANLFAVFASVVRWYTNIAEFISTAATPTIRQGNLANGVGSPLDIHAQDAIIGTGGGLFLRPGSGTVAGGVLEFRNGAATPIGRINDQGDFILISPALIDFAVSDALGAGAAATLGTIGGTGPTVAAQSTWLRIKLAGNVRWIPIWL